MTSRFSPRGLGWMGVLAILTLSLVACAPAAEPTLTNRSSEAAPVAPNPNAVLKFSGIPDQDTARWLQRYQRVSDYLTKELGVKVEGVPAADYAAVVVAFKRGDVQLAWFGGFTGAQARAALPGTRAIAQRPMDEQFHSVFIVQKEIPGQALTDLKGLTFTFGSESSTSGHLMPRYFLVQAGVDAEKDSKGQPGYSGSHDKTWKLVETGAFQSGVLSEEVWDRAVREGTVDLTKVRELVRTPPYYDYHWGVRPDLDATFGAGFTDRLTQALLNLKDPAVLEPFATDRFIPTRNEDYQALEQAARRVGLLR